MIHNEKSVLSHCILKPRKLLPQEGQQENAMMLFTIPSMISPDVEASAAGRLA